MDIGPGVWLERLGKNSKYFSCGGIYQCAAIHPADLGSSYCSACGDGYVTAIEIVGHPHPSGGGWCAGPAHWRPIYRPRKGAFDHLLTPVDVKEEA